MKEPSAVSANLMVGRRGVDHAPAAAVRSSLRILVVDDNEEFRSFLGQLLEGLGHQVIVAPDGLRFLNLFHARQGEIDVIFLDYLMPRMDGAETLDRLRRLDSTVKVIVVSGAEGLRLRRAFAWQHVDGFLAKPATMAHIQQVLQRTNSPPKQPKTLQ